jgi:nitrogen-specific signal transduction histidine kinase
MRYSLEETLGEQAFIYLDKIHSPVVLVHRNGTIKRINRAGKKLLSFAHLSIQQLEDLLRFQSVSQILTKKSRLKIFTTEINSTDYRLIEVIR